MAATRPVVLVFQEYASLSSSPATPELNCLIAGAVYHIRDFPEDRATIKLPDTGNYGDLNHACPYTPPVQNVAEVTITEPPDNALGSVLDASSVRAFFGNARVQLATGTDGTVAALSPNFATTVDLYTAGVQAGDYCIITDDEGTPNTLVRIVAEGPTSASKKTCVFSDEIPSTGFTPGSSIKFRFERAMPDSEIGASFIKNTAGTNTIIINGGVTLPVAGVSKVVTFAEVYIAYRSLRQDLADVQTIEGVLEVPGRLGRIDARNPGCAGAFVALQNTNTSVQVFGVTSDNLVGYNLMKSAISGRKDIYAVVPMIQSTDVIASLKTEFEGLADPDYAVTNGVPQKFRVVLGQPCELPTEKIVVDVSAAFPEVYASATQTAYNKVSVAGATFGTSGVLPGDDLVIADPLLGGIPAGTYKVAHVVSDTVVTIDTDLTPGYTGGTNNVSVTRTVDGVTSTIMAMLTAAITEAELGDPLFLDLYDPNGVFLNSGVMPNDVLEIPHNAIVTGTVPDQVIPTDYSAYDRYTVAAVISNQRLRIANTGADTSVLARELPHGYTRYTPVTAVTPDVTELSYRIMRTLDRAGQVTELIAVAASLASRRAVIMWPDLVDVAGLVDGSLPRAASAPTTPVAAGSQPGFYLAAAVGGMTAGLPSHQGFTYLGIAGVSKLYNSNTWFEDKHITQISNSGWFVFQQDTPVALPYCVHQLTTDPSTLEFGEYSMVKNMDFVSLFFADILDDFIGTWNINDETIGFMNTAVKTGIDSLKLRKRAKIGAPIRGAKITKLEQSTVSSDRVECYIEVDFPRPLNTVGLHIVSV